MQFLVEIFYLCYYEAMLHHIQKSILDKLATAQTRRYGELKPAELDGNVFGYHLKALLSDKYLSKSPAGDYTLTQKGQDYIVHRYENPLLQAHSIFLIVLRRGDSYLMRERLVQPLLGMSGFIHGEPVAHEHVEQTAERRLADKTGLQVTLRVHSSGLIAITCEGTLASYSHAIILVGETDNDITITGDVTGRNTWLPKSALTGPKLLPSCIDIVERIAAHDTTPFDLHYTF